MTIRANAIANTKSDTPGADKVKAAITWLGMVDGVQAEVRHSA